MFQRLCFKIPPFTQWPLGPPWSSDLSFWDSSELFSQILFSKSLSLPQIVLTLCSARRTATLWGEMDGARPPGTHQDDRWNHQRDKESTFPRGARRLSWYCPVTWGRRHKVQSNFESGGYGFLFFFLITHPVFLDEEHLGWFLKPVGWEKEIEPSFGNKVRLLGVLSLEATVLEQGDL